MTVKVAELAAGWVDLETGFQPKWRTKHYISITAGLEIISRLGPVKLSGQTYCCSDTTHFRPDINIHYVISL